MKGRRIRSNDKDNGEEITITSTGIRKRTLYRHGGNC